MMFFGLSNNVTSEKMPEKGRTNTCEKGPFDEPTSFLTVALEVEKRKFWVSRETLSTCSPVFEKMFYGEFAESKKDLIPLPGKKASEIEELLKCLIPHPLLKNIDLSNADLIFDFAGEYLIDDLRRRAEESLIALMHKLEKEDEKLFQILRIGSKYRSKDILRESTKRCGTEFQLKVLQSIFEPLQLTSEAIACLSLYRASMPPLGLKCHFVCEDISAKCNDCKYHFPSFKYFKMRCVYCGICLCRECLREKVCGHALSSVEKSVNDLLDRL